MVTSNSDYEREASREQQAIICGVIGRERLVNVGIKQWVNFLPGKDGGKASKCTRNSVAAAWTKHVVLRVGARFV